MKLIEIRDLLDASVSCDCGLEGEIHSACGADLMSDVLAFVKEQGVLLTGLVNQQVVRTAEMMDMKCIIFVRGKCPDEAVVKMAEERGMTVMTTGLRMYVACGILYKAGLEG